MWGGYCFGIVRLPEAFPSIRPSLTLFCLGDGFSDFIVILQGYVIAYEDGPHQVCLHCTNWKKVMALFYFQTYIEDR